MKTLAILHYHLRPGGVTSVIRNEERALRGKFRVRLLADFDYDESPASSRARFVAEARSLYRKLERATRGVDFLHTHNVGLGKHPRLTYAVKLLAQTTGIRLLNQVHDFPEKGRPAQLKALRYCTGKRDDAFRREMCYYDLPNVAWATLTTHDAAQLAERGIPKEKIHVLPNPIDDVMLRGWKSSDAMRAQTLEQIAEFSRREKFPFDPQRKILFSPMKVMVRKNNAEAVELVKRLAAIRGSEPYQLVIGLDAASPRDRRYSERIKARVRRQKLPVVIGAGQAFESPLPLYDVAHAVLTTSTTEGFGYTFVEGWVCGKLVLGRDIPEVTRDLRAEGMKLSHLYGTFDDEAVKQTAKLLRNPSQSLIRHNRRVVLKKYSLAAYAQRFSAVLAKFAVS